jgi:hypothetical protein
LLRWLIARLRHLALYLAGREAGALDHVAKGHPVDAVCDEELLLPLGRVHDSLFHSVRHPPISIPKLVLTLKEALRRDETQKIPTCGSSVSGRKRPLPCLGHVIKRPPLAASDVGRTFTGLRRWRAPLCWIGEH